jgi:hypothetical protein
MCCAFATIVLLGPRITGIIWWLIRPALWQAAFSTFVWPVLGLIFLPWTTLMYMLIFPGGIVGIEWFLIGMAVFADLASYGSSAYGNRERIPGYQPPHQPINPM